MSNTFQRLLKTLGGKCMCATYRDTQKHGVYWLSEGQRLGVLPVERLQSRHQSLPQLLGLKD